MNGASASDPAHGRSSFAAGGRFGPSADEEPEPVVVRDKRRVNPFAPASAPVPEEAAAAGAPAEEQAPPQEPSEPTVSAAEVAALRTQLEERTADLQRLKAEYDNFRRRTERDRQLSGEQATAKVLAGLLGTLDDIDRAAEHDDLTGPFRVVADTLRAALTGVGLERYGQQGDSFDPQVHEALTHTYQPGLEGPTCIEVYRAGYRYAGRVLRPAQVVVAEPPAPEESADGAA